MPTRGLSLVVQPDQWARCVHENTVLLPGGGVELNWTDPSQVGGPDTYRSPRPAGLAFDRWCRAYRSRPDLGRIDTGETGDGGVRTRPGVLRYPAGLAVDGSQRLYVAETGTGLVQVIDLWAQRLLRKIPMRCGRPRDVAPDCGRAIVLISPPALAIVDGRRGPLPGPPLVRPCYPGRLAARRRAPDPGPDAAAGQSLEQTGHNVLFDGCKILIQRDMPWIALGEDADHGLVDPGLSQRDQPDRFGQPV